MAPVEWYYARGNKQQGPASSAQLKQLAESGDLSPEDLVWREGMGEWIAAAKVKGLFEGEVAAPPKPGGTPPESAPRAAGPAVFARSPAAAAPPRQGPPPHLFDLVLEFVRSQFTAHFVESTSKMFTVAGHYGLYVAMLVLFGLYVSLGVNAKDLNTVLLGVVWVLVLAVLQYASSRFSGALEKLNRTTPGEMESSAFPDCFALLSMIVGLVVLLGLAILAVQLRLFDPILPGVAAFILCQYLAIVALNPETLNITIAAEAKAGEEAIGILSFLVKLGLRVVPVAFGVGIAWGTLQLLYACWLALSPPETGEAATMAVAVSALMDPAEMAGLGTSDPAMWPARAMASATTKLLVTFAVLPLLYYVFFLFYHLFIDVIRDILSLPEKLDRLAEKKGDDQQ